jgi:Gpi18-like mannosyltransferase
MGQCLWFTYAAFRFCVYSIIVYTIHSIKVYTYIMFIHILGGGMHWDMFAGAIRFYSYFHI